MKLHQYQSTITTVMISYDKIRLLYNNINHCILLCVFWEHSLCSSAYRQYVWQIYQRLGRKQRKVIPSCVVSAIQKEFPEADGNYTLTTQASRILQSLKLYFFHAALKQMKEMLRKLKKYQRNAKLSTFSVGSVEGTLSMLYLLHIKIALLILHFLFFSLSPSTGHNECKQCF